MSPNAGRRRRFHKIDDSDVEAIISLTDLGSVISAEERLLDYGHDEAPLTKPILPQVVVKPKDAASISRLLKYANQKRIPVTARGAGTGLSGGCIPVYGGIVLSLENMHELLDIDRENFTATVQPGLSLGNLREHLVQLGLSYPVSLGEMTATVGGSIATNAGGLNAVKYGVDAPPRTGIAGRVGRW